MLEREKDFMEVSLFNVDFIIFLHVPSVFSECEARFFSWQRPCAFFCGGVVASFTEKRPKSQDEKAVWSVSEDDVVGIFSL